MTESAQSKEGHQESGSEAQSRVWQRESPSELYDHWIIPISAMEIQVIIGSFVLNLMLYMASSYLYNSLLGKKPFLLI